MPKSRHAYTGREYAAQVQESCKLGGQVYEELDVELAPAVRELEHVIVPRSMKLHITRVDARLVYHLKIDAPQVVGTTPSLLSAREAVHKLQVITKPDARWPAVIFQVQGMRLQKLVAELKLKPGTQQKGAQIHGAVY